VYVPERKKKKKQRRGSSENQGEEDSGVQLVLFCCESFWFREALVVESFLGVRSGANFPFSFETEQGVCKSGF
jgi:hypothetical protein